MKKIILTITNVAFIFFYLSGQVHSTKSKSPLQQLIANVDFNSDTTIQLFTYANQKNTYDFDKYVSYFEVLELKEDVYTRFLITKPKSFKVSFSFKGKEIILLLTLNEIFTSDYVLHNEKREVINLENKGLFYNGIIEDVNPTMVSASFFKDEIRIVFSDMKTNYRITKLKNNKYILYQDMGAIGLCPPPHEWAQE